MANTKTVPAVKGMPDILPENISAWQFLESEIRNLMACYDYSEIRTPLVERTSLFKRSIGEVTDIVEKEMFTFDDQNQESISLRPEGTASCVRACVEHSLLRNQQQQRLWYLGPMYRYERPQKGRFRQFFQWGVEAFNFEGPQIEVEHIAIVNNLWKRLGIENKVTLHINTIGNLETRNNYKQILIKYFRDNFEQLDQDSKRRLETNPLRILDSKNPEMQDLIQHAPVFDAETDLNFLEFKKQLEYLGIKFEHNTRLVRGLDYYNGIVYEWITSELGAQGTVCAGGKYDVLVEQLGGPASSASGFALGLERVLLLLNQQSKKEIDIFFIAHGKAQAEAIKLAEQIRDKNPSKIIHTYLGQGSLKGIFKKADKSGAEFAYLIGDEELASGTVTVKYLRENKEQDTIKL